MVTKKQKYIALFAICFTLTLYAKDNIIIKNSTFTSNITIDDKVSSSKLVVDKEKKVDNIKLPNKTIKTKQIKNDINSNINFGISIKGD